MGLSVVTPPTTEPITLVEAKDQLRVVSADEDGLIAAYILSAREFIEGVTWYRFITQTLDFTADFNWPYIWTRGYMRACIELPVRPVSSITSVSYVDNSGVTQVLPTDQYVFISDGATPHIVPAYGVVWPIPRWQERAITVRFIAGTGSEAVPHTLRQAMRLLIAHQYESREGVFARNMSELPFGIESFVSPYRDPRA